MNDLNSLARQLVQEFGEKNGKDAMTNPHGGNAGTVIMIAENISIVQEPSTSKKGKKNNRR